MKKLPLLALAVLFLAACGKSNLAIDPKGIEIKLSKKNLTEIPAEISGMTQLKRLYLDGNAIAEVGSSLDALTELREIDISHNKLTKIPDNLGKLSKIQLFDASDNQLDEFPKALLAMPDVYHVDLRNNKLTSLPSEIKNLKKLEVIYLSGNDFTKEQRVEYRNWLPKTKIVWSDGSMAAN